MYSTRIDSLAKTSTLAYNAATLVSYLVQNYEPTLRVKSNNELHLGRLQPRLQILDYKWLSLTNALSYKVSVLEGNTN